MADILQALSMFRQGVADLQSARALNTANEVVQQIKSSEADEAQKTAQLRQVADSLTLELARYGKVTGADAAAAIKPKDQPLIQSFDQAMIYGNPAQQAAAKEAEKFKTDEAIRLQRVKNADGGSGDPMKNFFKEQTAFANFDKAISPEEKRLGVMGAAAKTVQRAQSLQALLGGKTKVSEFDDSSRVQIYEAAAAFAQMVQNGAITEGELKMVYPQTSGMSLAKAREWITNNPVPANQGGYVELYQKAAMRESALASAQLQENILSKSTLNSKLSTLSPQSEARFKEGVAQKLNSSTGSAYSANDIHILPGGKVTTPDQTAKEQKMQLYSQAAKEAKLGLNSDNPTVARQAREFFARLGLSDKTPTPQIAQVLKYRILAGEL